MIKKRPKARIKIGRMFSGEKISAVAEGYVIYKEWDPADRKNYYWEEWELRGFENYDSWVEYDHYTEKITLYEPLKLPEQLDARTMQKGQSVVVTIDKKTVVGTVHEAGVGTAVRREGALAYHVFEGDKVAYAEINVPNIGTLSVEYYNDKEQDNYLGKVLNRKEQKRLLGRVVSPLVTKARATVIGTVAFIGVFSIPTFIPSYENYCTPKTISRTLSGNTTRVGGQPSQPGDELVSESATQNCYRRKVYGGGGGGGGK